MSNLKDLSAHLNKELEIILTSTNGTDEVTQYLRNYFRFKFVRRCIKWFIVLLAFVSVLCLSIYHIPVLNWNASAVGRLVLIKMILPVSNWQYLYYSRCIIETFPSETSINTETYADFGFNGDECAVCENLDSIDQISNITYGDLQNVYLSRDQPVIIIDSHDAWPNQDAVPDDFIEFLLTMSKLRHSVPCNVVTNLLQTRDGVPNLQRLLRQTKKLELNEWFLHFRNCEFDAVKESRGIFPLKYRPYFMSAHLPPFHSSWILLSHNYKMLNEKQLPVKDLVFVFQLKGQISGRLVVQKNCNEFCADQNFQLNAGESLIFKAEMWNFFYRNTHIDSQVEPTITFIQEIHAN